MSWLNWCLFQKAFKAFKSLLNSPIDSQSKFNSSLSIPTASLHNQSCKNTAGFSCKQHIFLRQSNCFPYNKKQLFSYITAKKKMLSCKTYRQQCSLHKRNSGFSYKQQLVSTKIVAFLQKTSFLQNTVAFLQQKIVFSYQKKLFSCTKQCFPTQKLFSPTSKSCVLQKTVVFPKTVVFLQNTAVVLQNKNFLLQKTAFSPTWKQLLPYAKIVVFLQTIVSLSQKKTGFNRAPLIPKRDLIGPYWFQKGI